MTDNPDRTRRSVLATLVACGVSCALPGALRAASPPKKAAFCLVHGSTHGPGGWQWLAGELRARGAIAEMPLLPYEDAEAGIADCVGVIERTLGNAAHGSGVTVVAHSISGLLLPSLVTHPAVNRVVYLAAAVAPAGMSFRDYYQSAPDIYHEGWERDGARTREDTELARHYLYHDVGDTVFDRIREHRIAFAARKLWTERPDVGLPPAARCTYIAPTGDRVFRLPWMRRAASEHLGVGAQLIDAGHCPHLSRPRDVAAMLLGPA